MTRTRIKNDTDETIVIEPGESVDLSGEEERRRLMSRRAKTLVVQETTRR